MHHTSIVLRARFFACPSLALRLKAAMRARLAGESAVVREVAIVFWASLVELADSGTSPSILDGKLPLVVRAERRQVLGARNVIARPRRLVRLEERCDFRRRHPIKRRSKSPVAHALSKSEGSSWRKRRPGHCPNTGWSAIDHSHSTQACKVQPLKDARTQGGLFGPRPPPPLWG